MKNTFTKEELQRQLNTIIKKEQKEIIEKHYPDLKSLEGKCFKLRNNYSLPKKASDYWNLYVRVFQIKKSDVYTIGSNEVTATFIGTSFQKDKHGLISIDTKHRGYVHLLGDEITTKEFQDAWKKVAGVINEYL